MIADEASAYRAAHERWASIAHPLGGLGTLEETIARIARLKRTTDFRLDRRAVVVMCADNGVVAEGVSQSGCETTSVIAQALAAGTSSVCLLARSARARVAAADVGMAIPVDDERLVSAAVARGTRNIAEGPAMTEAEFSRALEAGGRIMARVARQGCDIVCLGEMGIGNTTTATAVACALLGLDPDHATGPGAGLPQDALARKADAVRRALAANGFPVGQSVRSDAHGDEGRNAQRALRCLGGFDLVAMAGAAIEARRLRVPVVVDGMVGQASALAALLMDPATADALVLSHVSSEPASRSLCDALGQRIGDAPAICAGMHLGEGAGAVCMLGLLDAAFELFSRGTTFGELDMEAYRDHRLC